MKNIRCLSDILADNGYETWFAKSADHSFAYTDIFYKMHSYSNIIDRTVLTAGMSPAEIEKNKSSYNGLSDRLLMDYISGLFTDNKVREPFLMTVFTVDTHAPGTVLPYNCPKIFGDIRDNILCTDNNIASFLTEFKKRRIGKTRLSSSSATIRCLKPSQPSSAKNTAAASITSF